MRLYFTFACLLMLRIFFPYFQKQSTLCTEREGERNELTVPDTERGAGTYAGTPITNAIAASIVFPTP